MINRKTVGALLGAGFSYDLGMPLASEFTASLMKFLTKKQMHKMISNAYDWLPYGEKYPLGKRGLKRIEELHNKFIDKEEQNYEDLFRWIDQEKFSGNDKFAENAMCGKLKQIVNEAFLIYQSCSIPVYWINKNLYDWFLRDMADQEFWLLSLNHDLMVESLCLDLGIPLKMGYTDSLSCPYSNVARDRKMTFGTAPAHMKRVEELDYFHNEKGVNLLKIHGGLNEFFQGDDKSSERKRMFIMPERYQNSLQYFAAVKDIWHGTHYLLDGRYPPQSDEICFSDDDGILQFMQTTVLTGTNKYHESLGEYKDEEKMQLLSDALERICHLYIIGYGFGDIHINNRVVHAMHRNDDMTITIINTIHRKIAELEPFDYKQRVKYITAPFPMTSAYLQTGKWDEKVRMQINMGGIFRDMEMKKVMHVFDREHQNR